MKIVHSNKELLTGDDWIKIAVTHEREGEFPEAVLAYHQVLRLHPLSVDTFDKLIRLHRDLKEYPKELAVINKAIRVFEDAEKKRQPKYNAKINSLSKALLKATGLADEKGKNIYQSPELKRWKKRREMVMKKMGLQ